MKPTVRLLDITQNGDGLVERAAHRCYRAEGHKGARFIHGILHRGHTSVLEHWNALFRVQAHDSDLLGLLLQQNLLRVSVRKPHWIPVGRHEYLVSGNARMFLKAKLPQPGFDNLLLEQLRSQLIQQHPVIFGGEVRDFPAHTEAIDEEQDIQLWSDFLPLGLTPEELMVHGALTLYFPKVSRTLTHQLVRHRMASYSQASQRYCGEDNFKAFVPDSVLQHAEDRQFYQECMQQARTNYSQLVARGIPREDARYVLPNACHSEIVVTMTLEHWANFLALRTDKHAQKEIRDAAEAVHELIDRNLPFDLPLPPIR